MVYALDRQVNNRVAFLTAYAGMQNGVAFDIKRRPWSTNRCLVLPVMPVNGKKEEARKQPRGGDERVREKQLYGVIGTIRSTEYGLQ